MLAYLHKHGMRSMGPLGDIFNQAAVCSPQTTSAVVGTVFPFYEGSIIASQEKDHFMIDFRSMRSNPNDPTQAGARLAILEYGVSIPPYFVANLAAHETTMAFARNTRSFSPMVLAIPGSDGVPGMNILKIKSLGHPAIQLAALLKTPQYEALTDLEAQPIFHFSALAPNSVAQRKFGSFVVTLADGVNRSDTRVALIGGLFPDGKMEYFDFPIFGINLVAQADLPQDLRALAVSFLSIFDEFLYRITY